MSVLLFAGQSYDCNGGWDDLIGEFKTIAAARKHIDLTRKRTVIKARTGTYHMSECTSTSSAVQDKPLVRKVGDRVGSGTILAIDGDVMTVRYRGRVDISWAFDWAHIVVDGSMRQRWSDGVWEDATEDAA